jgi:hypothetical protein
MPADLANHAAAVAEGYVRVQVDYGPTVVARYCSRYEKPFDGDGQSGALRQIEGYDASSQVNADQKALDALNGFRRHMFGGDASNTNKGPRTGNTLVPAKN